MESIDLRIDNIVQDYNNRIVIVSKSIIYNFYELQTNQNTALIPVPLTEEELIKCNFTKHKENKWLLYNGDFVANTGHYKHAGIIITWRGQVLKCDYLHELQNAWKVLTGIELKIK